MKEDQKSREFIVKDCAIATIATGDSAGSLIDFREKIAKIPLDSLYYHFWMARLRPHFIHAGFHNEFALWVQHVLNEVVLAEKLSIVDPLRFDSLETLRAFLLDLLDENLDEKRTHIWAKKEHYFHFITSKNSR